MNRPTIIFDMDGTLTDYNAFVSKNKALKVSGLYGLSPGGILATMAFLILFFAMVFGACGVESFAGWSTKTPSEICASMGGKMTAPIVYSFLCMIPFPSGLVAGNLWVSLLSGLESFLGIFFCGYLSFAVVKRTLRN